MKNFIIFISTTIILTLIAFHFKNNNIVAHEIYSFEESEITQLVDDEQYIVFEPHAFSEAFIYIPRLVEYQITMPLSMFYNKDTQQLNYKLIKDFDKFLNIVSRQYTLSTLYVNENATLIKTLELANYAEKQLSLPFPFIDLTGNTDNYFSLEYFNQLLSILKHSTVQTLNPEETALLLDSADSFISDISFKIIKAFNPIVNIKDKNKAQQIVYLLQHIQDNPYLLDKENSPLNNSFF